MSESNGKSILSLEAARAQRPQKDNDFITVKQARGLAYDLVMQECAKVHEHYLTQIPVFVARQIQDALLLYGLLVPAPGTDITPSGDTLAPPVPETPSAEPSESDTTAPAP